jgi:hypothetical protein
MAETSIWAEANAAYNLSLKLTDWDAMTSEEGDVVAGWQDGLWHKYLNNMESGRSSITNLLAFDPEATIQQIRGEVAVMQAAIARMA